MEFGKKIDLKKKQNRIDAIEKKRHGKNGEAISSIPIIPYFLQKCDHLNMSEKDE
jgi:hypothetical protein